MKIPALNSLSTLNNTFKTVKPQSMKIDKLTLPKVSKKMNFNPAQFTGARTTSDSQAEGRLKVAANAGKMKIMKTAITKIKKKK